MRPIALQDVTHTALIVADLAAAIDRYAAAFAMTFAPVHHLDAIADDGSDVTIPLTWSQQGPVHLELITATPGTLWSEVGRHHVGVWSDDVAGDAAALVEHGFAVEMTVGGPTAPVRGFAYLRDAVGLRVELTSSRFRAAFDGWLAGEELVLR